MRKILFRGGKAVNDVRWVYGDLGNYDRYKIITVKIGLAIISTNKVIPETVGQYTRLQDKNGTKIFEHDIVKTKYDRLCKVVWLSSSCRQCWDFIPLEDKHKYPDDYDLWIPKNLEVVGNIYDNSYLLEVNQ